MDEPVLKNLWDADVPGSDPRFALAVMARIERRRFRRELAQTAVLAVVAVALLAMVMPAIEIGWRESFAPHISNVAILILLGAITLVLPQLARD